MGKFDYDYKNPPNDYEEGSIYIPDEFVDDMKNMNKNSIKLYIYLQGRRSNGIDDFPSYKEISQKTKIKSNNTISSCIRELSSRGWIDAEEKDLSGDIYLILCNNLYKIGKSKNYKQRKNHFNTIMPIDVEPIHVFKSEDIPNTEKFLHKKYSHCRVKGEWFNLSQSEVEEICSIQDFQL